MPSISPVFEDLFAELDHAKIEEAILTDPDNPNGLLGFEYSQAKELVLAAGKKWLVNDLRYLDADSLRIEFPFEQYISQQKVKGIIDLAARFSDDHWNPAYRGKRVIMDWKSASGALDKTWENRHIDSFQWKTYCEVEKADFFSYRGISKLGQTREVLIEVPAFTGSQAIRHFTVVGGLIKALSYTALDVWPQHMPGACGAYGQTCPFLDDCKSDNAPRFAPFQEGKEIVLSYSSAERFLTCPEKYRRMTEAASRGLDESESTRLGSSVHRALAELWQQAFAKYGK